MVTAPPSKHLIFTNTFSIVPPQSTKSNIFSFITLLPHIGSDVAQDLLARLRRYAIDPDDPARTDHLIQICRTAARARKKIRRHPSSWEFGSWGDEVVLFPSVTAGGQVVMEEELD